MAKTRDYMDYLDEHIEIAPANSQEEYQAAETIADVMSDHGLEASIEEFDARPWGDLLPAVLTILSLALLVATNFLSGAAHYATLLLALVGIGLQLVSHFAFNVFEGLGPAARSQNVVAVHRAEGSKVVKGARPIVIVAHYDTPRESLLRKGPIARVQASLRRMAPGCQIAVAVVLVVQALGFLPGFVRTFAWVVGLIAGLPLLFLAIATIYDRYSPCTLGANDNKASVAALLSILDEVRPSDDRVGKAEGQPERMRAADRAAEAAIEAQPRRVEVCEEVYGVRHGAKVLESLGILPPTCEVVYEEPKVRIVEEPAEAPANEPAEGAAAEQGAYEPDYGQTAAYETAYDTGAFSADRDDVDTQNEVQPQDSADASSFELNFDDEYEEENTDASDEDGAEYVEDDDYEDYEDEYEEVDYDEFEDDEYEEGSGFAGLAGIGAWFADRFASLRARFAGGNEDEEDESEDTEEDLSSEDEDEWDALEADDAEFAEDEDAEYEELEDELAEDEETDEAYDEYDEYGEYDEDVTADDELEEDNFDDDFPVDEDDESPSDEDTLEDTQERPRASVTDLVLPGEDLEWDDEDDLDIDSSEDDYADETLDAAASEPFEEAEPEDEYNEWLDVEGLYEEDPASDEEYATADHQTLGSRIKGFFDRLLGEEEPTEDAGQEDASEDANSNALAADEDAYEEFEEIYDEEYEDDEEDVYLAEEYSVEPYDEDEYEDEEDYLEGYEEDASEELVETVVAEEPPAPAPRPSDPNELHLDREEDVDIAPRDTTGLDTISDNYDYDLYDAAEPIEPVTYEKPEPIDDPNWGISSYQPARPVMNIARRAALFDLPDPSATYVDPLQDEEDIEDEYEGYEDDATPMTYDDDFEPNDLNDLKSGTGFWNDVSDWKGGATVRADLRDDESDEPIVIDADDLQDAILEMGDEFLVAHDIWFVATGASTIGHAGIKAFLEEHRRDIRGAFLVNLESIGAGSLSVIVREGLHAPRRADRRLVRMLTTIAEDLHIPLDTAVYNWDECESATAMRSRVRSVSIMGMDDDNLPAYACTQDDVPDNVDPRQVSSVVRLITELIRRS